jgi:pimeloyl-ACP methyl ester carboxylesterase
MATYKQYYGLINGFMKFDYNIVTYDHYGCGDSDKPYIKESYNTNSHLDDFYFLFNKYSTEKNIIVGHSYGTCIVTR